ncbi:MAG TPA: NTP transferase domain-containing protein [Patescibacteria group bacterium]|nr:NTP transferase domain-containing protein [Patescibacteria group bacterium]
MTQIIILAAGKGTRMGSELPKVLVPLNERPMIDYLVSSVMASKPGLKPIVVVSPENKEIISQALKMYDLDYVVQAEQLGTGHAVSSTRNKIKSDVENILVLYGDHPFLKTDSIKIFLSLKPEALTIMPTLLPNFSNWYHNFYNLGRIVRDDAGEIKGIVEFKDANDKEKLIKEINLGFMCFNKEWLFKNIDKLKDNNKAHEFYLTDMVEIAFSEGYKIGSVIIEPREAMGINRVDELKIAEDLAKD